MITPLSFPDPQLKARRRAEEFQLLLPENRWREMAALMAFGWAMVKASPNRAAIERRMDAEEEKLRQIQRELFARHGQGYTELLAHRSEP